MTRRSVLSVAIVLAAVLTVAVAASAEVRDSESIFNTGLVHLREGRIALALEEFKKALKEDPKNPYFYKGIGLAYMQQLRYGDAIGAFRKALDLNPYFVDAHNDLGTALVLSGKREEGKREFVTAFGDAINPTPEFAANNLGRAYFEEKNYAEAAQWFRTALTRNKAFPDPYLGLSDSLQAMGNLEDAIVQLETGSKEVKDSLLLAVRLGEALRQAGRLSEACARFEDAARRDPAGAAGRRAVELLRACPNALVRP